MQFGGVSRVVDDALRGGCVNERDAVSTRPEFAFRLQHQLLLHEELDIGFLERPIRRVLRNAVVRLTSRVGRTSRYTCTSGPNLSADCDRNRGRIASERTQCTHEIVSIIEIREVLRHSAFHKKVCVRHNAGIHDKARLRYGSNLCRLRADAARPQI